MPHAPQQVDDWSFLNRAQCEFDWSAIRQYVQGKCVLITGAGGFIGSALARSLSRLSVRHLLLLDIAESRLHELAADLDRLSAPALSNLIVGDICDAVLLAEVCERHRPQIVLHAGACKHVALMEENPFVAVRTNVLGTHRVVEAANRFGIQRGIVISTDKAVAPTSIMGASKRIAELIVLKNRGPAHVNAVRLGNVLGSTGSVVPILQRQIAQGGPLTLTDTACTRYFVTVDEAVGWLLSALLVDKRSEILVTALNHSYRMDIVVDFLLDAAGLDRREIEIRYTGLRPGEKLAEQMTLDEEISAETNVSGLLRINSPQPSHHQIVTVVEAIHASLQQRDLDGLLQSISSIVPDYTLSARLQPQRNAVRHRVKS